MRNKKFIESLLSAITIAAIASQFVGCSSASRSEAVATKSEPAKQEAQEAPSALLQMLQENKEIEIDKPVSGEESKFITRLEAMSLLAKSTTPVQEAIGNQSFTDSVGQSEFTDLASLVEKDSYLTTSDKSLNPTTANGTITRGEYIYMLLSNIFGTDRISSADLKKASFNDCKDAGDIAGQQKLKESDKSKDYYDSAELKYTLNNPDGGCPAKMYQSLAAAQELGIISADTRWDEGLTKEEAIQLYLDTMQAYTKQNGYQIDQSTGTSGTQASEAQAPTETEIPEENLILDIDFIMMDEQKQVKSDANLYSQADAGTKITGSVKAGETVHVVSKAADRDWYGIESKQEAGLIEFIEGKYLADIESQQEKPQQEQQKPQQQEQQQEQQKPQQQEQQQPQQQEQQKPQEQQPQQQQQTQQPQQSDDDVPPPPPGLQPGDAYNAETGRIYHPGEVGADGSKYIGSADEFRKQYQK